MKQESKFGEVNLFASESIPVNKIKALSIFITKSSLSKKRRQLIKIIIPPHNGTFVENFLKVSFLWFDEFT